MATNVTIPSLDDRRWADLVEEARALIPLYAPGWTDHNAHDPGISVIELLAWVAEMDLFALDQVTAAHRRKLLALAGDRPRPPRPAEAVLTIGLVDGSAPVVLPAGAEFEGRDPFGNPSRWRGRQGVVVQPGALTAVMRADDAGISDLTDAWRRSEPVLPFGPDPRPGHAFYLGFALPTPWTIGDLLSIGLVPAAPDGRSGAGTRSAIAAEMPGAEVRHHSVGLLWEMLAAPDAWIELAPGHDVDDGTRALTLDGRVTVRVPFTPAVAAIGRSGPLAWVRARLARGAYDAPPVMRGLAFNAVEVVQAVPAVTRLRVAPAAPVSGEPPELGAWARLEVDVDAGGDITRLDFRPADSDAPAVRVLDVDLADHHLTVEAAAMVRGTGAPRQRIDVGWPPLVEETVSVHEWSSGAWRRWTARPDFDASGRADSHFVVDAAAGTLTLGDGERGRTAGIGSTLLVVADVTSAGTANLAQGAIDRLVSSAHNAAVVADLAAVTVALRGIANVVPASGGAAAETTDAAIARVRAAHEHATRAVTVDDYATLVMETPGTQVSRVEVRPNLHPGFPCVMAPGVVTVLALPSLPVSRPTPSGGLRHAIARHLDRRRVVGTRVEVVGPSYVVVIVRATVRTTAETDPVDVAGAIRARLDAFFDPLVGGPSGSGWPLGRNVYRAEVLSVIDDTTGVDHVVELELVDGDGLAGCGDLCVGPTGLVASGPHEITVR